MRPGPWIALVVLLLPAAVPAAEPAPGGPPPGGPAPQGRLDPRMPDLFFAVGRKDVAAVRASLKGGVPADTRNFLGITPLMYAALIGGTEVAEALLEGGARVDTESPFGSALTMATVEGQEATARMLLERGAAAEPKRADRITPLMAAASCGHTDLVRRLLERGAVVDARNNDGATALAYAARAGQVETARLLLEKGAQADAADSRRWTPLMYAAANGRPALAELLLEKGAKVDSREAEGRTPLLLAVSYGGSVETVRLLLDRGADVKAADQRGRTPAALAAIRKSAGVTELLRARGAVAAAAAAVKRPATPREAAALGLKAVQTSTSVYLKRLGCASCHHQGLGLLATGMIRDLGFSVDEALARQQVERVLGQYSQAKPLLVQAVAHPELERQIPFAEINEATAGDAFLLSGLAAQRQKPDAGLAAAAVLLGRRQQKEGHWDFHLQRVPQQSSFFTMTALAVRSLKAFAPKEAEAEISGRIGRARQWLLAAKAEGTEDRAFRLLGLKWAGAAPAEMRAGIEELRAAQQADGGWAQLPSMKSDAYAAGEAITALRLAGVPASDPAVRKGVAFLLRTQDDDGSWFVNKRAAPLNFYTDAGFPHGESQYASFNGTCWASMALALVSQPASAPARGVDRARSASALRRVSR